MNKFYSNNYGGIRFLLISLTIILLIIGIVDYNIYYSDPHWETITITDKGVNPGKNTEKWLIYTQNEVYCITDLFFSGFFESSDVYNSIEIGKTYKVYVSGYRLPIVSGYKVIRKTKEIE